MTLTIKSLHKIVVKIEAEFHDFPTGHRDGFPVIKTRETDVYIANSDATAAMALALITIGGTIRHIDPYNRGDIYEGTVLSKVINAAIPVYELPVGVDVIFAQ